MDLYDVQIGIAIGALKEAIVEPGDDGNGWMLLFRDEDNTLLPLTTGGHERIFHDLDKVTRLAKDMGFKNVSVVERF